MAVRNIRSIGSRKPIPVFVWIPPRYSPIWKIEVYDGTTATDVTAFMISGEYTDGITETIGNFQFKIDNSTEQYSGTFNLYDEIRIYLDYATTATTLKFVGMVERVSKSGNNIILSGRGSAAKVIGKNITYSATDTARSTILSEIISDNFTSITTNNLESDTTTLTVNYFEKPFWDIVEEICLIGGRDAYIDKDFDFHYFESGSRSNSTEAVVHNYNLIETGDFAPDASSIINKVRVYGAETEGIPLIYTSEDSTSQTTYESKDLKITDTSITTAAQAQSRADYELAKSKDPPTVGTVLSLGLPTISPGEQIRISDPMNGLDPSYYQVHKFVHKFDNDKPFMTELTIQKERTSIPKILRQRVKFEAEIMKNVNPNDLDYSRIWDFSTSTGTHSNTEISISTSTGEGVLKTTGGSTGTWISELVSLSSNISAIELRIKGDVISGIQLSVSTDGGIVYTPIVYGTTTIPAGSNIKVKLVLNSATTQVKALALLYNL
jgi:hypothetical protein